MLSSFCSPLNSISDIQGIILVVTAGIISVLIGGHFGGGDHFDGGDHFGGGTSPGWNIYTTVLARLSDCGVLYRYAWLPRAVWEMSRRKEMWVVKTAKRPPSSPFPSCPLIFLFYFISYFTYFFLVSDFAPHSTIWTPGTCYTLSIINRDVDCQGPAL